MYCLHVAGTISKYFLTRGVQLWRFDCVLLLMHNTKFNSDSQLFQGMMDSHCTTCESVNGSLRHVRTGC